MQYVDGYFYKDELSDLTRLTIIDVGAYIGDTVDELFERYGDKICTYYAYEPEYNNYKVLNDQLEKKHMRIKSIHLIGH